MTDSIIDALFALLRRFGDDHYGEAVTQMEHILQCGHLARRDDAPAPLVAAALLHDIGQFLDGAGMAAETRGIDARHEESGAACLAAFFAPEVTEPVRLHVEAKRYLCATEPGYQDGLSGASALSLRLQGGPHDAAEQAAFAALPWAADALRLRRYDDAGKRRGWAVPALDSYRPLLAGLIRADAADVSALTARAGGF